MTKPAHTLSARTFFCMRSRSSLAALLTTAVVLCLTADGAAQDEAALHDLWAGIATNPADHRAAITACDTYLASRKSDPLRVVAESALAWHLLRAGETNRAASVLQSLVTTSKAPLPEAASQMARRWMTRIQHQEVRERLRAYYADEIEFPDSLEVLAQHPAGKDVRLVDAFGDPWSYELKQFKVLSSITKQRYELASRRVGTRIELQTALGAPYGDGFDIRPVRKLDTVSGRPRIRFEIDGQSEESGKTLVDVVAGERAPTERRIYFAYAGPRLLILSNGDYWAVLGPAGR